MALRLPPARLANLTELVNQFNSAPVTDTARQLFYLQKINYELNKTKLDGPLFDWINEPGEDSWHAHLLTHGINPYASVFLTGMQFAQAVTKASEPAPSANIFTDSDDEESIEAGSALETELNEYQLMQRRDTLFEQDNHETCQVEYRQTSIKLNRLAQSDNKIIETISRQNKILSLAHDKIEYIKGVTTSSEEDGTSESEEDPRYETTKMGTEQTNNYNFILKMQGWDESLVFRVEDRPELKLEQALHSHEVANYFIEDYAVFMMEFKDEDDEIEYKPVVLSQFANQGNLQHIAIKLKTDVATGKNRAHDIAPITAAYFEQLSSFCTQLMAAGAYHPDIKLSNFLVDRNRVRLSDRKTLTDNPAPKVKDVRSSPAYAPDEYLKCIARNGHTFNTLGTLTHLDMPQFMSFQLGMALKEFLILTQLSELPDDFRDPDRDAASYFDSPCKKIINLSLLAQELTRAEPGKRLPIDQFQGLLRKVSQNPDNFYALVEEALPSRALDLDEQVAGINRLLNDSNLSGEQLTEQANAFFKDISNSDPKETRLTRLAEKLAIKCYQEVSRQFFTQSIIIPLANANWAKAPWYRKLASWLSFGFFPVEQVTRLSEIKLLMDVHSAEFQRYFPQLEFLPTSELDRSMGVEGAQKFEQFIYDHVTDILPPGSESDPENERLDVDESSSLLGNSSDDLDYNTAVYRPAAGSGHNSLTAYGTMVVRMTDTIVIHSDEERDTDTDLNTGTMVVKPDSNSNSHEILDSGTIIIHREQASGAMIINPKPAQNGENLFKGYHFFVKEPDPDRSKRLERVRSICTSLFRNQAQIQLALSQESMPDTNPQSEQTDLRLNIR